MSRDDYAVRYRFASGQQSNVLQLGGPSIAWRFVSLPAAPVVDVTVSPRGENDLAVEVTTDSAEAEALLGYLRTGAVEGADVTAESLLRQKRRDPIAAAIGGYYLLRTANLDRLSAWGPNLSQWFPWLPDGAVINGWQHIHAGREHRGDPDRHFGAARRQLIQAAQRGVPVYTEGLRLLVDGLRLLREDAEAEDAELDAALTFIEPFAMAADWSAATVTYSGADPAEPNPSRRYGIPKDNDGLMLLRPQDWPGVVTDLVALPASEAAVRDLAEALGRARDLARDLANRDLDRARELAFTPDLDHIRDLAEALALDLDRPRLLAEVRAGDLAVHDRWLNLTFYREHYAVHDLDRYLIEALVRDLVRALNRARDLAEALGDLADHDLNLAEALARDLADRDLAEARADARDLAEARARARDRSAPSTRPVTSPRPAPAPVTSFRALDHARDLAEALMRAQERDDDDGPLGPGSKA